MASRNGKSELKCPHYKCRKPLYHWRGRFRCYNPKCPVIMPLDRADIVGERDAKHILHSIDKAGGDPVTARTYCDMHFPHDDARFVVDWDDADCKACIAALEMQEAEDDGWVHPSHVGIKGGV